MTAEAYTKPSIKTHGHQKYPGNPSVGKTNTGGALLSLLGNLTAAKLQSFPEIYNSNAEISYNTILLCSGCCKALQLC
jgi:hypothetical protein